MKIVLVKRGYPKETTRWREENENYPTYYQVPYRSLISDNFDNLTFCGRMVDDEEGAFGALRAKVNMNQLGEETGTADFLALDSDKPVFNIDTECLRATLKREGSIIL